MRKTGRIFQAGTQRRSVPNFSRVKELVQEGTIGPLTEMHASVYVPSLNNNWLPAQPTPDPEQCDWNVWLGPAPWRPYNAAYLGFGWRGVDDFEAGARLLDWGVHTVDLRQWVKGADGTGPVEFTPSDTGIVCRYADGVSANSWILGRTLGFDPAAEAFTSGGKPDAEANGLRSRPEREVWA